MPRQNRRSLSPLVERNNRSNQRKPSHDCRICRRNHPLRRCPRFNKMNVADKLKIVKKYRYCENCLGHSHQIPRCRSDERCRQCKGKHHTLLHRHRRLQESQSETATSANQVASNLRTVTLLPTIIVKMQLNNEWRNIRGLLNPGVEFSSIAEYLIGRYRLPDERIGSERWCKIKIRSRLDDATVFNVRAKATKGLPRNQPKEKIDKRVASLYTNLRLADQHFCDDHPINFVLGADIYPQLIKPSIQPATVGNPMAQDTVLGWTIIGTFGV